MKPYGFSPVRPMADGSYFTMENFIPNAMAVAAIEIATLSTKTDTLDIKRKKPKASFRLPRKPSIGHRANSLAMKALMVSHSVPLPVVSTLWKALRHMNGN